MTQADKLSAGDTSSRFAFTKDYWKNNEIIDEGKLGG